jgi:hypothetical protein
MTNGLLTLYMVKYLRISSYIRKPFLIHDFATTPFWISFFEENFLFFFISLFSFDLKIIIKRSPQKPNTPQENKKMNGERGFDRLWSYNTNEKQNNLIESVHFIKSDNHVGSCELFFLWAQHSPPQLGYHGQCVLLPLLSRTISSLCVAGKACSSEYGTQGKDPSKTTAKQGRPLVTYM